MKVFCGILTIIVGIVLAFYSLIQALDDHGDGFYLLVVVGVMLVYTGIKVMKA